jgi:ABC-type multidrug transport system fused ATPase/permease subunit
MLSIYQKVRELLTGDERKSARNLFFLMLLMGAVEAVGVASIMPFLTVIVDPSQVEKNEYLSWLYHKIGFSEPDSFLLFLGGAAFLIVVVGVAIKVLTYWRMASFAHMRNYSLSTRLLKIFLGQTYAWFLKRNTSDLHKKILSEVQIVVDQAIIPVLRFMASAVILFFLMILLVYINPLITLLVGILLGGSYFLIYYFLRNYLVDIGVYRVASNQKRFRAAQESLTGIKHVKAMRLEGFYIDNFKGPAKKYAKYLAISQAMGETPRFLLEALAVGGMLAVVLFLLLNDTDTSTLEEILPLLGVYGFSAMRLLPAIQQIYQSATKLRFSKSALEDLCVDLARSVDDSEETPVVKFSTKSTIVLESVDFSYEGAASSTVRDVNLNIEAGTTVAFVGKTGAGKSTIVDIIMGLLSPDSGTLFVDGKEINKNNLPSWKASVGYVPQESFLSDDSILSNIAYGIDATEVDVGRAIFAAKQSEIHSFILENLPEGYQTKVGEKGVRLSGGQAQRIAIARALYREPSVLILDEATSALDTSTEQAVMESIYSGQLEKTVILIAHRLSTVERCDKIFFMEKGRVVAVGTYEQLLLECEGFKDLAVVV